jgi:hypothetical protein
MLDGVKVQVPSGKWHTIKIVHTGSHITTYLNGKKYMELNDSTFTGAGGVGVWTKADALTYFDDLKVKNLQQKDTSK